MALSDELRDFCNNWRAKAAAYSTDNMAGAFDRFFTSYVAFNRLYVEATHRLARRGRFTLRDRFPDDRAAQEYVVQFCTAHALTRAWENDPQATAAIRQIADHLRERRFALRLHPVTGNPRRAKDRELLAGLESQDRNRRANAVLEALYAIRCNMFHGHKAYALHQLALLQPAIVLLEATIEMLHRALEQDPA